MHARTLAVFVGVLMGSIGAPAMAQSEYPIRPVRIVVPQSPGSGGDVVARLADEVTVKRFRRRGHSVQLLPENPDFEPIEVDLRRDSLTIEGVAVGVIRNGKGL